VYQLSPDIELLFTEAGTDYADRVGAAAAAGFDAVEMWGTLDQNIGSLRHRLQETGVSLTSVLAEPRTNFTLPGTDLGPFFDGLHRGVENARELNCPGIVLGSVDYVQIADSPGRGEPGTGTIDWPAQLATLHDSGYAGPLGLEYFPTVESIASVAYLRGIA
jgi:hydroxypyruvate isomerase